MTHTKTPHKPFTKKFWILLGTSVLSLLLIYGGIVWAVKTFVPADECQEELSVNCIKIGAKNSYLREQKMDKQTTVPLKPRTAPVVKTEDRGSPLWAKQLVIKNTDPNNSYFIPLRTEEEIVSAYKSTQRKDGKGLAGKVSICAKGGDIKISETKKDEVNPTPKYVVIPGCKGDPSQCVIKKVKNQSCYVKGGVTNWKQKVVKNWRDGTNFNWKDSGYGNPYGGGKSGADSYLYVNKNKIQRCRHGSEDGDTAWYPKGGEKHDTWQKFTCDANNSDASFHSKYHHWVPRSTYGAKSKHNEYFFDYINAEDDRSWYGVKAKQYHIVYTGQFKTWCGPDESNNNQNNSNNEDIDFVIDEEEGDCWSSCRTFNNWFFEKTNHAAPRKGCSQGSWDGQIRDAVKAIYCNDKTCDADSNCERRANGHITKQYSEDCEFEWKVGEYGECSYGSTSRSVFCISTKDKEPAYGYCDIETEPKRRKYCTSYRWVKDGWTSCNACNIDVITPDDLPPLSYKNPLDLLLPKARAAQMTECSDNGGNTVSKTGQQEEIYYCMKEYGDDDTVVSDQECIDAGLPKPTVNTKECTEECPCLMKDDDFTNQM